MIEYKYPYPIFERIEKKRKSILASHRQFLQQYRLELALERREKEREKSMKLEKQFGLFRNRNDKTDRVFKSSNESLYDFRSNTSK